MSHTKTTLALGLSLLPLALSASLGCSQSPPEPTPDPAGAHTSSPAAKTAQGDTKPASLTSAAAPPKRKVPGKPTATVSPSPDDPLKGKWTLDDATKGLPAGKTLVATLETELGKLECTLFDTKAPITVANFVGLARGIRPWKSPEGKWDKKPLYDGTVFHRIIKGFMIQGGDPKKNGTGDAGFEIPDEVWEDGSHDRAGLLCMANHGANTNSAQFFITDEAAPHLDGGYTIFGECGPLETVHALGSVEMAGGDRPKTPPVLKKVTISRK
ncbi:MAG: peptidylprolyl isomerase [Byssovorax sp.]